MTDIVIATNNDGKMAEFEEMRRVLAESHPTLTRLRFVSQRGWNVSSPTEDADSFRGNALIKARHTAAITGHPAIGDDSGLVVDALDGRPGIFSSRFAGEDASDAENNAKLVDELARRPDAPRSARFVCALASSRTPGTRRRSSSRAPGKARCSMPLAVRADSATTRCSSPRSTA